MVWEVVGEDSGRAMEKRGGVEVEEDKGGKILASYVGIACALAVVGLRVPRSSAGKERVLGSVCRCEWEVEKSNLVRKIDQALAEVEEMKKRRCEDAKANDKVAAMFAARTHQWKAERNQLRKQLEMLLKQSEVLERSPSPCPQCTRKEEMIAGLEAKSLQLNKELIRAFDQIESCERERKNIFEEKEEITQKFAKLLKDDEEKGQIISCLLRKSGEKDEFGRELSIMETQRRQGDWTGLDKSLYAAHIKQRHLQELDAFERQMRAKDERMEAFRQKLLLMEDVTEKLKAENAGLAQSLEQAKLKIAELEVLLEDKDSILKSDSFQEKNRAFYASGDGWRKVDGNAKIKLEKEAEEAKSFSGVHQAEYTGKGLRSFGMNEHENYYEKQKERLRSLLVTSESMPKTYLDGSIFVGKHKLYSEEMDHILPVEDVHLKYLIEEATQAFNSGCKLSSLEGARKTSEKTRVGSFSETYETEKDDSEVERNHPEDSPVVVDKHVSETLQFNQTETEFELQSGLGFVGERQKGRASSLADTESQITMLGHNGQLKGKTVSEDLYLAYKTLATTLEIVHPGKEPDGQVAEQSTSQLQTAPGVSFLAKKDDDIAFDAMSYLTHMLQRDSSWNKAGVLEVSSEVKTLEHELLQLENIAKTMETKCNGSKDGKSITNVFSDNGNENRQIELNQTALSSIRVLKKQVKRYQAVIGKIDDLCRRMNDKDPVHIISGTRTREYIAAQELFLMETAQLQRYVVAMGQKLTAVQSDIARNLLALNSDVAVPANFNVRQSIVTIKINLKEIQRSLEIKLARIIGDLEGTLARDGILHVMPVEWRREHSPISGKSKTGSHFSKTKQ
ncbi:hypothetical protein SUGI_0519040 [Cryptomeria japonica]|uniref:uncharacterized protein LOC131069169 n=1 Tax=Cryptomeria japonica TaxID=3369 RepID=UPI002408D77B|nr:uncharacterized protein LOC131069169 [Cryptomeria japonica]GLJ26671.1 hypothetical protein SUGI_0519040 [Cryptomeria japonica]